MITKFLRKRNVDPSKPFNKNFARIQVNGNLQTFRFKKTAVTPSGGAYLTDQLGNRLTTESGNLIITG